MSPFLYVGVGGESSFAQKNRNCFAAVDGIIDISLICYRIFRSKNFITVIKARSALISFLAKHLAETHLVRHLFNSIINSK